MQKIFANVEDHRVIDNDNVVEDVNNVGLPTIEHGTNTISVSGMVADVDMPDMAHLKAMECSIAHNNGVNCRYLSTPGKHNLEFRAARQKFSIATGDMGHESVKFRITGLHKSTDKGSIERGNPYGSTDKYSVLRYEEEINGEIVIQIDVMAGIIKINGKDYAGDVESLLA